MTEQIFDGRSYIAEILDVTGDTEVIELQVAASGFAPIRNAILGVITGNINRESRGTFNPLTGTPPPSPLPDVALLGEWWEVRYEDTVLGGSATLILPTPDLSLLQSGSEFLDLDTAGSVGNTLRNEFETFLVTPNGNPLIVISAQYVT